MSTKKLNQDLNEILARCEEGMQDLKTLIQPQLEESGKILNIGSQAQNLEDRTIGEDESPPRGLGSPVSKMETDAIMRRIEGVRLETEISWRLARVERQVRRLTVLGAMSLTILSVGMLTLAFLLFQTRLPHQTTFRDGKAAEKAASAPSSNLQAKAGDLVSEVKTARPDAAPPLQGEASPRYVGSITSNKYHYPDCKWAKTIIPGKLIGFKSVAEAEAKGYIPCPTCNPPHKD